MSTTQLPAFWPDLQKEVDLRAPEIDEIFYEDHDGNVHTIGVTTWSPTRMVADDLGLVLGQFAAKHGVHLAPGQVRGSIRSQPPRKQLPRRCPQCNLSWSRCRFPEGHQRDVIRAATITRRY